jgi:hypothetical protein
MMAMNRRPPDPSAVLTVAERARLIQVNRAARDFFRRELPGAERGWAAQYLRKQDAEVLLDPACRWAVGYAPNARSRLVDHLRSCGFALELMRNAGLGRPNAQGRVGVAKQLELLTGGAAPVLVTDPLDAIAITHVSMLSAGRWAGIPMLGPDLSPIQIRIIGRHAATDTVVVVLPEPTIGRRQAERSLKGLAAFLVAYGPSNFPAVSLPTSSCLQPTGCNASGGRA